MKSVAEVGAQEVSQAPGGHEDLLQVTEAGGGDRRPWMEPREAVLQGRQRGSG